MMEILGLLKLGITFFNIGLFTIGGGVVAITLMQQTIVANGLITQEQFYNMVAISESTPGPLGVNMATYIGYHLYGVPGGIIVTLFQVSPSIIIILIIAKFLKSFNSNPFVKGTLEFLRPITTGLVLVPVVQVITFTLINIPAAFVDLAKLDTWKNLFEWKSVAAYELFVILLFKFKLHPIFIIILGAAFGIVFL